MILLLSLAQVQTDEPLVTVVMIAYNAQKTVERALDSVLRQSYTNFRILCVDDGSTDATAQILKDYRAREPRMRAVRQKENRGVLMTRIQAIKLVETSYFLTLDADDELSSELLLGKVDAELRGNYIDILHYNEEAIMLSKDRLPNDRSNPTTFKQTRGKMWIRNYFLTNGSSSLVMHGKVLRTELVQEVIGTLPENILSAGIRYFEDALLMISIAMEATSYRAMDFYGYLQYQGIATLTETAKQRFPQLKKSTLDMLEVIKYFASKITSDYLVQFQVIVMTMAYEQLRLVQIWQNTAQRLEICNLVLSLPWIIPVDKRQLSAEFCLGRAEL